MYKFLDFMIDTRQHALIKDGEKLDLGSTAYKLLLYFVKNSQATLTKDELINTVWQEKTVSESTLYKQVQRLRTLLGDTADRKEIISTVHGIGFVFLPEVKKLDSSQHTSEIYFKKAQARNRILPLIAAPLLLIIAYFVNENRVSQIPKQDRQISSQSNVKPVQLAVISNFSIDDKTLSWMTNGGIHYLAENFDDDNITIKRVSSKDLKTSDANKYAINLSKNDNITASIILAIAYERNEYSSTVLIRDDSGVIATSEFSSHSIKDLLDSITQWSKKELRLTAKPSPNMSSNSFAVENYIRGMAASTTGDDTSAIKYFELATMEDNVFWLAWYELASSYAAIGQSQKALSVLNNLELTSTNPRNQIKILSAKTINYYQLDQYDLSLKNVNRALEIAKINARYSDYSSLLTNKSLLLKVTGDFKGALVTVKESIAIIKQTTMGDNFMGLCTAYNSLAGIHYQLYQYQESLKMSEKAVKNCLETGDKSYLLNAKTSYAQYLMKVGEYKKSRTIGNENLALEQQLNDKTDQIDSLLILTEIDIVEGLFEQAEQHLEDILNLQNITNNYQQLYYTHLKIELSLLTNQLAIAKLYLEQQKQQDKNQRYYFTRMKYLIKFHRQNKNKEQYKKTIQEIINDNDLRDNPFTYFNKAQLAVVENKSVIVKSAFKKAMELVLAKNNSKDIAEILNPYIKYLIETKQNNQAKYVLAQLEQHKPPDYPFLKIKAQLYYQQDNIIKASALMSEQKTKANDFWTSDDQLLLEKYQEALRKL